mmetsp:Transcript_13579/g.27792  ORF Transcript_13579/g.27792 Transcript_13579/m.27792 type:complete len:86 (-) Transcript_13579:1624-1881(-)
MCEFCLYDQEQPHSATSECRHQSCGTSFYSADAESVQDRPGDGGLENQIWDPANRLGPLMKYKDQPDELPPERGVTASVVGKLNI